MELGIQSSQNDYGDNDRPSTAVVVVAVLLPTLIVLLLIVASTIYVIHKWRHSSKHSSPNQQASCHTGTDYIANNTIINPTYFTVQQIKSSQVQEMVSIELEFLNKTLLKEDDAIKVNIGADTEDT